MKITILYPCSYFDIKKPDEDYEYEYHEAVHFPEFQMIFYHYDDFVSGEGLKFYPRFFEEGIGIYRGWMLQPERYRELYEALLLRGLRLINSPKEYEACHEFPGAYPYIRKYTPGIRVFQKDEPIDWKSVKEAFGRFMMKDYVKSVKGTDFPVFFDSSWSDEELEGWREKFIQMRGSLFVKGFVLKEFVDLKKNYGVTNEYRVFFLDGKPVSISPNSNQKVDNRVPEELVQQLPVLPSHFYTVDFAELENGTWVVIETGDGQVSGLSPNQYVFQFYEALLSGLKELCRKENAFGSQYRAMLEERSNLHPEDDHGIEELWQRETEFLAADIQATIQFLKTECTPEEFTWMSEVFEDLIERTQSRELFAVLKETSEKYREETAQYHIEYSLKAAECFLND